MFYVGMSIRQLLRTPVKTLLFVLLLCAVTIMLAFGSVLYLQTQAHIEAVENQLTTIGMVTQRPSSTQTVTREFGCGVTEAAIYDVYDEIIPIDVLNFEGANYIRPPEERMSYLSRIGVEGSGGPGAIKFIKRNPGLGDPMLVELEALENSVDGSPTSMRILQQKYGAHIFQDALNLCQHYASEPTSIMAGEKYMAVIRREFCSEHLVEEYIPLPALYSSQYNLDGTPMEGDAPGLHLFWQDEEGSWMTSHTPGGSSVELDRAELMIQCEGDEDFSMSAWTAWLQSMLNRDSYYPAIATNSLYLVPSYQSKRLKIKDGRAITQDEFDEGAHVCMIPESWNTTSNQFSPGELSYVQVPISVSLKNYPASKFDALGNESFFEHYSLFDSNGNTYVTFAGGAYQIVGTFTMDLDGLDTGDIDLAANCMIIPSKSVARPQENLAYFGPMTGTYVSFQIPNGTIAEFDRKLHEMVPEADMLDIAYSDNGYEKVMPSLERTHTAALLLCGVGAASAVAVIVFLVYFFIIRERRRTAIERGLGMTKRQCRVSLIAGVLILALLGCFLGSLAGVGMMSAVDLNSTVGQESSYSVFNTKFSDWTNKWNQVTDVQDVQPVPLAALAMGIPLILIMLIAVLSLMMVESNLKVEPIMILGEKDD